MYEPIYLTPSSGFNVESYFDNDPLTTINNIGNTSQIDHLKDTSSEPMVRAARQENYKFTDFSEPVDFQPRLPSQDPTQAQPQPQPQDQFQSSDGAGELDFLYADDDFTKNYTAPTRYNPSTSKRNAGKGIDDPFVSAAADFLEHVGKESGSGSGSSSSSSSSSSQPKNRTREMIYNMLSEGALNVWSAADQEAKKANEDLAAAMSDKLAKAKADAEAEAEARSAKGGSLPWGAIAGGVAAITVVGIAVYFLSKKD